MARKVYLIHNIDCANCAAKIERKIAQIPGVEEAVLTFTTKQLRITAQDPDALLPDIQKTAETIEPGVTITARSRGRAALESAGQNHHDHHHHHEHGEDCSCGHDHHDHHHHHEHSDSCGCGHDHHHEHSDSCGCGHEHHEHEHHHSHHIPGHPKDCQCELCHPHEEYCDICGEILANCTCHMPDADCEKKVYLLENLGCANCAAKMEAKIKDLPGVEYAAITFATKQLRVTGKNLDALTQQMQDICSSIESEVVLKSKDPRPKSPEVLPIESAVPPARKLTENNKTLIILCLGAALFIAGEILEHMGMTIPSLIALVIGYILLGGKVVLTAVKNLTKGQIFDENFLMSIATLGAFAIREWPEAVGVMLFYRIGEYFEHIAVEKSRTQIMEAVDMRPEVVNLVIGAEVREIPAEEANVGDILLVRPGDRIPLDSVVIEGESRIDTSPVTGEPVPVKVGYGDEVTSGCVNTNGLIKIRVEKILEESMVTRILDSVENAAASKPKIDHFITRFARIYTPIVVLLALGTAIIPSLFTGNWNYWIYTALSFLVMSCPCALVLSVPLAFFSGIGAGSKKGILFKGGISLEAMSHVNAVVMDKTGTITEGNFVVQEISPVNSMDAQKLLSVCASCELSSTHPIGASILSAARDQNLAVTRPSSVEEIAGHGIRVSLPEGEVLCGNEKLMKKFGVSIDASPKTKSGTQVFAALNGTYIGSILISDTVKQDAKSAIAELKKQNIVTAMLTGDEESSARAVADATGIDEVHARLLPQDKLNRLQQIRNRHGSVMFVGDGINDAPVLAGADVGAAMGSGADAAIEAADVVFMTSSMEAIPQSLSIARATSRISWQNVVFALIIKVAVMILGLVGHASMWMAVFADTGVAMLCVLNSIRILYKK